VDQYAYYEVVTNSADKTVPGCASEVRNALTSLTLLDRTSAIEALGLCEPLPDYIGEREGGREGGRSDK
jgi:hypothetical protein